MALNNVPLSGQTLNDTRNPINNNFATINAAFNVNHGEYNTANQGKHTWVAFTQQTGATPFVNGEVGLSNYNFPLTGTNELWITLFNSATTKFEYPISSSTLSTVPAPNFGDSGFFYLPCGMFVKFGRQTGAVVGANTVNLNETAAGGPRFNTIINALLMPISGTAPFFLSWQTSNLVSTPQTFQVNIQTTVGSSTGSLSAFTYFILGA